MLNRLRNTVTRTVTDESTGQSSEFYAIFPADRHMDHLALIIKILGPPSPSVIRSITNEHVRNFVLKTVCVAVWQKKGFILDWNRI